MYKNDLQKLDKILQELIIFVKENKTILSTIFFENRNSIEEQTTSAIFKIDRIALYDLFSSYIENSFPAITCFVMANRNIGAELASRHPNFIDEIFIQCPLGFSDAKYYYHLYRKFPHKLVTEKLLAGLIGVQFARINTPFFPFEFIYQSLNGAWLFGDLAYVEALEQKIEKNDFINLLNDSQINFLFLFPTELTKSEDFKQILSRKMALIERYSPSKLQPNVDGLSIEGEVPLMITLSQALLIDGQVENFKKLFMNTNVPLICKSFDERFFNNYLKQGNSKDPTLVSFLFDESARLKSSGFSDKFFEIDILVTIASYLPPEQNNELRNRIDSNLQEIKDPKTVQEYLLGLVINFLKFKQTERALSFLQTHVFHDLSKIVGVMLIDVYETLPQFIEYLSNFFKNDIENYCATINYLLNLHKRKKK